MSFGALCGFEYAAIFAGESRNPPPPPDRAPSGLPPPLIALLYIFGTSAILAYVSPDNIDVIGPIPQALRVGAGRHTIRRSDCPGCCPLPAHELSFQLQPELRRQQPVFLPCAPDGTTCCRNGSHSCIPASEHPVNSIFSSAGSRSPQASPCSAGVGAQEAFELLLIWAFTFYAIAYLALFAIPVLAGGNSLPCAGPLWMKVLASFGFLMTLLFVVLSIFLPLFPSPASRRTRQRPLR